jgi:heat shock protein HtpX
MAYLRGRLPELELAARTGERLRSRSADADQGPLEDPASRAHAALDLIDAMAGYTSVLCLCGLRVKTPPESNAAHIGCPRCGRVLDVPQSAAEKAGQPVALPAAAEVNGTLRYQRAVDGWEAFRCSCGQTIQLGAGYPLDYTICAKCGRRIEIGLKS